MLGGTPLHQACWSGRLDEIPARIFTDIYLMAKDPLGCTPLHYAARCGHLDKLPSSALLGRYMLQVDNDRGETPLHLAAKNGHFNQVPAELITENNLLLKNIFGQTVLHYLVKFNDADRVLGIKLPNKTRKIVGEAWWSKNQEIMKNRLELVDVPDPDAGIDLF